MNHHSAFKHLRTHTIASLALEVTEYEHIATGAKHFHLAADNTENVFLVGLRTVPTDSTGVAHILEHTALCGSERFPVRDPFFMMIRRSLNTFMNAFTSADWTAYPFATQNRKDFDNLLDVYLDAVFFSRLDKLDFRQEGHRLEFATPNDPNSPLVYKGVVFNEMKGAMSSPVSQVWQAITSALFTETTYHFNSGGTPLDIPNLTYEQLVAFYRTHYHPSNAVFMTYGNIPVLHLQTQFHDKALSRFSRATTEIKIEKEPRLQAPKRLTARYTLDQADCTGDKTHVVLAWLLGESTDLTQSFQAQLLSRVLLDNSASPLLHALETAGLGSAPSPLCGLEDSYRDMSFMCGLEGTRDEHAEAIEALIFSVLEKVAEEGVPKVHLEAALHQLELSQREITGNSSPYGLQLIQAALSTAIHRGDPIAMLDMDPVLEQLRVDIEDPNYIKRLVKTLLLDNRHWVRLVMSPDPALATEQDATEKAQCEAIRARLSASEKQAIIDEAAALKARQTEEENMDCLPKVSLSDIPAEMTFAHGTRQEQPFPYYYYPQGTNGLVYLDLVFDLPELSPAQLALIPHYTNTFGELGCGQRSYTDMQTWQSQVSGGIQCFTSIRNQMSDAQKLMGKWIVSGKALTSHYQPFCDLMQVTLNEQRYDELDRIKELTAQYRAEQEQRVVSNGHSLAMQAACAGISPLADISARLYGLAGLQTLKKQDDALSSPAALQDFAATLHALHQELLSGPRVPLLIAEANRQSELPAALGSLLHTLPSLKAADAFSLPPVNRIVKQMWITSTAVNFCATAYPTVPLSHPDSPALTILAPFLRNGYLHSAIREQGGAYGGGASQDNDLAAFRFYSYRDPRLVETLQDFEHALEWLASQTHTESALEEAILGVIASIDKPSSPAGEARSTFYSQLFGRSNADRAAFRQALLTVTLSDLQRVASTYLKPERASTAIITSRETLQRVGDLGLSVELL